MKTNVSAIYDLISEATPQFRSQLVLGLGCAVGSLFFAIAKQTNVILPTSNAIAAMAAVAIIAIAYALIDLYFSTQFRKLHYKATVIAIRARERSLIVVESAENRRPSSQSVTSEIHVRSWRICSGSNECDVIATDLKMTDSHAWLLQLELNRLSNPLLNTQNAA